MEQIMEDLLVLFQEIINHKPEDALRLMKKIEQQLQRIKGSCLTCLDESDLLTIARLGSKAYFSALSSAKLARVLYKLLKYLPKICDEELQKELAVSLEKLLVSTKFSDLKTLSLLLDQNLDAKRYTKSSFNKFSELLRTILSRHVPSTTEKDAQEYLQCGTKLCIQALQLYQEDLQKIWDYSSDFSQEKLWEGCPDTASTRDKWEKVFLILISHLNEASNKDHLLLLGTALAMVINCAPSQDTTVAAYMDMISVLKHEKLSFHFCGIQYNNSASEPTNLKDTSWPVIAVIKGLLVSCDKKTLKSGEYPLILQVYPNIIALCKGPTTHHYLTFQLLALWYQKLEDLKELRPSGTCLQFMLSRVGIGNGDEFSGEENQCVEGKLGPVMSEKEWSCVRSESSSDSKQPLGVNSSHTEIVEDKDVQEKGDEDLEARVHRDLCDSPTYMSADCPVLGSTLDCIWLNWESPVDGVSEYVLETFRRLLRVWSARVQDRTSGYSDLCLDLFHKVLGMAWHCRTRYRPLSLLLPYFDCGKAIAQNPVLKEELLLCMKTNHMAPIASDTYKAFLQEMSSKGKAATGMGNRWEEVWMPVLIEGLTSEHMLQRLKVATYWLEPTLTLIPESRELLLSYLEKRLDTAGDQRQPVDRVLLLYAWTVVSRVARENFHSCCQLQSESLLRAAFSSPDDLVRGEAFIVLASTLKKSEPVNELEISLLCEFLPYNIKTDSASFRHNLTFALRKILVRIRDSCLSALRNKMTEKPFVESGLAFVDWLYKLLMLSLAPGSSYQRRQTAFDLLFAFLETLMYQEDKTSRKGKAHESSDIVVKYAQSRGMWNFYSREHFLMLLTCLEDGAEEIQRQSYKLLVTYFKWPSTIIEPCTPSSLCTDSMAKGDLLPLLSDLSFAQQLMDRAMYLISRPRAYENHSGLLMFSLILDKYVTGLGVVVTENPSDPGKFLLNLSESTISGDEKETALGRTHMTSDPAFDLLELLVCRVEVSLEAVKANVTTNVKANPIHGILQCITQCLQYISHSKKLKESTPATLWSSKLQHVVRLNQRIINFILEVLAGGKSLKDCPSFADIGSAIESLVLGDEDAVEETTTLSPEFQLLLSWCWINLKESCTCLAGVAATAVLPEKKSQLDATILQSVGETFITVLTTCRHRGAIEGCRSGLYQFSLSLMSSKVPELVCIPKAILQKILGSLSENSLTSSVTRRSAGLPIIVQTILQAACRCGDRGLLVATVEELYSFAIEPLPESHNQQHDLRQSHALNILKTIFCDASLAPGLMPLLSKMVILVTEGFDSPSWAIRNAATQLISTLVTRIFGQRSKISTGGSMSLEEFAALYPEVLSFLCDKLGAYLVAEETTQVRPSLYVMLTVLANLGPLPGHQHSSSCRGFLQKAAVLFLSSPVFSLRKLAAQVWVSLSSLDNADSALQVILGCIHWERRNQNLLHGWMLCAHCLFAVGQIRSSTSHSFLSFCVANQWLTSGHTSCLLVASLAMQTMQLAVQKAGEISSILLGELQSLVGNCLAAVCTAAQTLQVAKEQCIRECIMCLKLLHQTTKQECLASQLKKIIARGLQSDDPELRTSVLECLHVGVSEGNIAAEDSMQGTLWESMLKIRSVSSFIKSAEILLAMALKRGIQLEEAQIVQVEQGLADLPSKDTICLRKTVFDLEGILTGLACDERILSRIKEVNTWCQQQVMFSSPIANENLRMSAATALRTCGVRLIDFCCVHRNLEGVESCLVSIIRTALTLLEDTEDEIRQHVSLFISHLGSREQMHYSVAYLAVSEAIAEKLGWCTGLFSLLTEILYKQGCLTSAITGAFHSGTHVLFEAETSSAMSEMHISQLWAFYTLQNIILKYPEVHSSLLRETALVASKELNENLPVLRENLKEKAVFNISNDENVLRSLLGIVLLSVLCKIRSAATDVEDQCSTLQQASWELQKLETLHTFLQNKNYEIDGPFVCNLLKSNIQFK